MKRKEARMAIQPIDLQAIFSQVDKVGKTNTALREGLAVQQEMHGIHIQRKKEEEIQSVNETQNTGEDGAEKIKDKESKGQEGQPGEKDNNSQKDSQGEETAAHVISDLNLGRNIDISL